MAVAAADGRPEALGAAIAALVRGLGLLRPDTTPCGVRIATSEAHVLNELFDAGPLSQQELTRRLRLQKSSMSRLVDSLQDRGWVRRVEHPRDGRSVLVELTAAGRRVAGRLAQARADLFRRLLERLEKEEQDDVVRSLIRLAEVADAVV